MHSFHHSRGRVLFEVFCALAISASLIGAWVQTGASALLAAGGVSALYSLVHAFGLVRRNPVLAVETQPIELEPQPRADLSVDVDSSVPLPAVDPQPSAENAIEEAGPVEPAAEASKARSKPPRKSSGRRAGTPKKRKLSEPAPLEPEKIAAPVSFEEAAHVPLAPLFEPEPFLRMPRPAFGRKAG